MTGVSIDSLTAGNLPKLVIDATCKACDARVERSPAGYWFHVGPICGHGATVVDAAVVRYLVPILGGVAPICSTCGGEGCEEGCGTCEMADAGPDSHKVCRSCRGSGMPTSITLTVECDDCHGGLHVVAGSPCPGCDGHLHHRAAAATLLLVLPIARRIGAFDEWDAPYDKGSVPVPRVGLNRSRTQMLLHPGRGLNVSDISALLPLASWETSKWALLVKDLVIE